jgi:hypothetical protein
VGPDADGTTESDCVTDGVKGEKYRVCKDCESTLPEPAPEPAA